MTTPVPRNLISTRSNHEQYLNDLATVFMAARNRQELKMFLDDFLSPTEIKQLIERYRIGDQLLKGVPQREVKANLKVSITKVSRASYMLKNGVGGFFKVWTMLQKK